MFGISFVVVHQSGIERTLDKIIINPVIFGAPKASLYCMFSLLGICMALIFTLILAVTSDSGGCLQQ